MLISQPVSSFGDRICEELDSTTDGQRQWHTFEFAVAWVNHAGAKRITDSAENFLTEGGCIRATVGLDFSSTSYEGLSGLLDLEGDGADIKTHVFFDENPACTFHPKVFLFRNDKLARLFVGSNNMTGAGLAKNIEVSLAFTEAVDNETIENSLEMLERWRDEHLEPRTRQLTREFLEELHDRGYVRTEEEIRASRESEASSTPSEREPLFGKSETGPGNQVSRAGSREFAGGHTTTSGSKKVLLMRVRPRRNGKQVQISKPLLQGPFFKNATEVVSSGTNVPREVGSNKATRTGQTKTSLGNTLRFEAPELKGITNPVARFQWVNGALQYEIFDADDKGVGTEIYNKLLEGITTPPVVRRMDELSTGTTVLSIPSQNNAQWYRIIPSDGISGSRS